MNLLLIGLASVYTVAGCLGCNPHYDKNGTYYLMANGQRLNDYALTVALTPSNFRAYKNQYVKIKNLKNGKSVFAKVTDTGGFAKYNRVADLSLATKNAIGCSSLCNVEVSK